AANRAAADLLAAVRRAALLRHRGRRAVGLAAPGLPRRRGWPAVAHPPAQFDGDPARLGLRHQGRPVHPGGVARAVLRGLRPDLLSGARTRLMDRAEQSLAEGAAAFDAIAGRYDTLFSPLVNPVIEMIRGRVYDAVARHFPPGSTLL